ncbi:hypothetical protein P2D06_21230, partial [Xanthomonas perforans]
IEHMCRAVEALEVTGSTRTPPENAILVSDPEQDHKPLVFASGANARPLHAACCRKLPVDAMIDNRRRLQISKFVRLNHARILSCAQQTLKV